ncbi:hypothetical protein AT728_28275 [Streptomyces silvensis]|uniref:Uncharacterized protein n=1 Tax=Streptomyces silvensis TaxID=1765722 RepID=A0A0W7XB25_9ACTN|nr:hypothetical protein AT728_28275 [Streptomyces silvensis]
MAALGREFCAQCVQSKPGPVPSSSTRWPVLTSSRWAMETMRPGRVLDDVGVAAAVRARGRVVRVCGTHAGHQLLA